MKTYRNPTYKPMDEAGTTSIQEAFKRAVTVANTRSDAYPGVKTDGIKIRGTGAATKGVKARGPMA